MVLDGNISISVSVMAVLYCHNFLDPSCFRNEFSSFPEYPCGLLISVACHCGE